MVRSLTLFENAVCVVAARKLLRLPPENSRKASMIARAVTGGSWACSSAAATAARSWRCFPSIMVDLVGKGKRVRTVPMPAWARLAIDEWTTAAGITTGRLLPAVNKGDRIVGAGMTAVVLAYEPQAFCGRNCWLTGQSVNAWR
jgi:hypothetical protein